MNIKSIAHSLTRGLRSWGNIRACFNVGRFSNADLGMVLAAWLWDWICG
ncbi:hypothetical protein INS55_03040 [Raoultella terrigena]|nr:hypothetical protein [Raoultella terrigena]